MLKSGSRDQVESRQSLCGSSGIERAVFWEGTQNPCCADRWCCAHRPTKDPTGCGQMEIVIRCKRGLQHGRCVPRSEFRDRMQRAVKREISWQRFVLWQLNRGGQSTCNFCTMTVPVAVVKRYANGIGGSATWKKAALPQSVAHRPRF